MELSEGFEDVAADAVGGSSYNADPAGWGVVVEPVGERDEAGDGFAGADGAVPDVHGLGGFPDRGELFSGEWHFTRCLGG